MAAALFWSITSSIEGYWGLAGFWEYLGFDTEAYFWMHPPIIGVFERMIVIEKNNNYRE